MHLNLNQAISQRITNLESEIERLKSSETSLSRPSAVQELWDKIRAIQKKINRLKESNHPDTSMHFRERNEIRNPLPIILRELNPSEQAIPKSPAPPSAPKTPTPPIVKQQIPVQNEGRSWGYLIGGTMLVGAVAALGFYLLSNMSVSSSPNPPTPPNPRPGCGNQDKPPATPPCPPPAPTPPNPRPGCGNQDKPPATPPCPPPAPTPPNPRPGCGNQDKPPATPPCPPPAPTPAPPKPKKHHHKPTWHIRSTKVFGVPVGIKIEKK